MAGLRALHLPPSTPSLTQLSSCSKPHHMHPPLDSVHCLQHEDLEAERLFDFSVLAPLPAATPLALLTCHDSRLAGAGEGCASAFRWSNVVMLRRQSCKGMLGRGCESKG